MVMKNQNRDQKIIWPSKRIRKRRKRKFENWPIDIKTSKSPAQCAWKLRKIVQDAFHASKNFSFKYKNKVAFGEVSRWIEEDWIEDGVAFYLRKNRILVVIFPTVELYGIIIPTISGSRIRAKLTYTKLLGSYALVLFLIVYFLKVSGLPMVAFYSVTRISLEVFLQNKLELLV